MIQNYCGIRPGTKLMVIKCDYWPPNTVLTVLEWRPSTNKHGQSFVIKGDKNQSRQFSPGWVRGIGNGSYYFFEILKFNYYIKKL